MKIYLGCDHAGVIFKDEIKDYLTSKGYDCEDYGSSDSKSSDDYPDFILPVARSVSKKKGSRGIILGGSGQGEAIVANKIKGVRAAVYYGGSLKIVKLSREHNDSNILSLGSRFLTKRSTLKAVDLWLTTSFSKAPRHVRRNRKVNQHGSS